jgi:hypothetical protein
MFQQNEGVADAAVVAGFNQLPLDFQTFSVRSATELEEIEDHYFSWLEAEVASATAFPIRLQSITCFSQERLTKPSPLQCPTAKTACPKAVLHRLPAA